MKLTPDMVAAMKCIAFFDWLGGNAHCHQSTRRALERRGLHTD